MIPAQPVPAQASSPGQADLAPDWRRTWRESVRDPRELLSLLGLDALAARVSVAAAAQFPLRVPRGFVARMRPGDPDDPLLRQVLPRIDEDRVVPGFALDAVGDGAARAATGVIHKYQGRALLVATGSCAIHCRYCFRRHFDYGADTAASAHWAEAIAWLRADPGIQELLLSGGDPLSLATPKLAELTDALVGLPGLRRLRLHTRLPVVLPERVDAALLDWLASLPWSVTVVIHANHANELDDGVRAALARLRATGATLLNQAVLLRGVNDDADTLAALSEDLFDAGVLPYYLHQLDRVTGTAHFEVTDDTARALHSALQSRLPGYLVPRLVREVPGAPGKTPL
jgi:EF-P beta-lysylation protein EpmB